MSETIRTCPLNDLAAIIPMDRDEFYREQIKTYIKTGTPTLACELINVLMFNTRGQLILQKRSHDKFHNPGLIDKTIGGHVQYEDTVNHTVMVETVQELLTPSIVLNSKTDFTKAHTILNDYLETIALVRHIETDIFTIPKIIDGKEVDIANKSHIFFGAYDGRIKPADSEAQGVLFYTIEELEQEMKQFPMLFTYDLHIYLERFKDQLTEFAELVQK